MTPTVGRVVHFVQKESPEHVPAIVCHVHVPGAHRSDPRPPSEGGDGTLINIGLWDPSGNPAPGVQGVPEDQKGERPLSWHYPEGGASDLAQRVAALERNVGHAYEETLEDRVARLEEHVEVLVHGQPDEPEEEQADDK